MQSVRQPAVAGQFYPCQAGVLAREIAGFLSEARAEEAGVGAPPKAIIVPHAGYVYSGSTAALAYARLAPLRGIVKRVVLLGPVHRVAVRGLALDTAEVFATPLGTIAIDQAAVRQISDLSQVVTSHAAHAMEHSLEVQLPFLQSVLGQFNLLPLAVGDASPTEVAQVLEALWGGPETLFVISSDLPHYLPYATAQATDRATVEAILQLQGPVTHNQACGGTPINGLLLAARQHHLKPALLGLCNSGDTAGDKSRVVGYAAIAFAPEGSHDVH